MSPYTKSAQLAAYRSVGAHGVIANSDPHSLVLTLFDAVLGRLTMAHSCIEKADIVRKAGLLHSSVVLLGELRGSLDLQSGGSLARNLSDLYEYMTRRLVHANANDDVTAIMEVQGLLRDIREAWAAIGPEVRGQSAGAATG